LQSVTTGSQIGVLEEFLCMHYGYCSQALRNGDEMAFIVQLLCLQHCCVLLYDFHYKKE